jgi:hypothetical protein
MSVSFLGCSGAHRVLLPLTMSCVLATVTCHLATAAAIAYDARVLEWVAISRRSQAPAITSLPTDSPTGNAAAMSSTHCR